MNGNNYLRKPQALIQDRRLTPMEQDYLCLIAQLEKVNGCTASNQYFADFFGVKRHTAVETISGLKAKKVIETTERKSGRKTIERTIRIIDPDIQKILLSNSRKLRLIDSRESRPLDSRKSLSGIVGNADFDSRKPCTHTIESTLYKKKENSSCPNSDEFRLAELFLNLILERKSDFKKPNLQTWAKDFDKLIRLDKRTPAQIERVIRWTQQDKFWNTVILSPGKLRDKFDQLEMKMESEVKNHGTGTEYSKSEPAAEFVR